MPKLTEQQLTTLRVIARSPKDTDGWAPCAYVIYQQLIKTMPITLVEIETTDEQHRVRLTDEALILLKWS